MVRLLDLRETSPPNRFNGSADAELWPLAAAIGPPVQCGMAATANLVEVAALIGDTARATMLAALMGGEALTGSELAHLARVSRPTASEHLTKLARARLLTVTKRRRNRYYRIASPLVGGDAGRDQARWRRSRRRHGIGRARPSDDALAPSPAPATTIWPAGPASP